MGRDIKETGGMNKKISPALHKEQMKKKSLIGEYISSRESQN